MLDHAVSFRSLLWLKIPATPIVKVIFLGLSFLFFHTTPVVEANAAQIISDDNTHWNADIGLKDGSVIPAANAQLFRVYYGVLNRLPDAGGFDWWSTEIAEGRHGLRSMAEGFISSTEFQSLADRDNNGVVSHDEFLSHMYNVVFGRNPDEDGYRWWVSELESGNRSMTDALVDMTQSNEYVASTLQETANYLRYFGKPLVKASFVMEAPLDYIESLSGGYDVQIVLPVDLNDDNYKDFIVHYWGSAAWGEDRGTYVDVPTPDSLITFVSDENGNYRVANELVFGTQIVGLGGASRKFVRKDINGDGHDDFVFAMNWEDGRSAEIPQTMFTEQVLLLSNGVGSYEIVEFDPPNWGHSVGIIGIDEGINDLMFAGFHNGANFYRHSSEGFRNVTHEYPESAFDWAGGFISVQGEGKSDDIIGTERRYSEALGASETGLVRYKRGPDGWQPVSSFWLPVDLITQVIEYQGTLANYLVANLDGTQYIGANFYEFCTMPSLDGSDQPLLVARFQGSRLETGEPFREGTLYDLDELTEINRFMFFRLEGDKIAVMDSPLVGETDTSSGNFFDCIDVNKDGLIDLAYYRVSNAFFGDDQFGKPDVFLNDGKGKPGTQRSV